MTNFSTILFLGARVVLASIIGLTLQIVMLVKIPDYLLAIQEAIKAAASRVFEALNIGSQYHIAYNLIGGDNIIVHTFFVLVAYIAILILVLIFKPNKPAHRNIRPYY